MYQGIQPFSRRTAQDIPVFLRNIRLFQDSGPDGIVDIVIDIGDFIGEAHQLSLQRRRVPAGPVVPDAVPHLPGQIQALAALLQLLHHPDTLFIMGEARTAEVV